MAASKPEWRLDLVSSPAPEGDSPARDQRNWQEVERYLREAEKALPQAVEPFDPPPCRHARRPGTAWSDARSLLSSAQAKDPRNLRYRLTLARLTQRQGKGPAALQILDQAEKDLGPSLDIQLARLDYWGLEGGVAAKAAVAKLAETRQQIPAADRPAFLDRLGSAEIRLGELKLWHGNTGASWRPSSRTTSVSGSGCSTWPSRPGTRTPPPDLVDEIRKIEGDEGTTWRFAQAALLIDKVRRGFPREPGRSARAGRRESPNGDPSGRVASPLSGEIAELAGSTDQAIGYYLRAVELGNVQPSLVRRLVGLLNERNRFDEIDRRGPGASRPGSRPG